MAEDTDREQAVDMLCPECGHAFKRFTDRLLQQDAGGDEHAPVSCPVCGCGECRIGH